MDDDQKNGGQSPQASQSLETNDQSSYSPESLEGSGGLALTPEEQQQQQNQQKQNQRKRIFNVRLLLHRFNAYLIIFLFLVVVGVIIILVAYFKSNGQNNTANNTPSQNLSTSSLEQLANSGTVIGGPKQTLNIESNSVFQNAVLVRGDLDVAGSVKLGGSLALQSLTVGGSTTLGQLTAQSLSISGNVGVQGELSALSLSVAGGGSFNGPLTAPSLIANSLQLNGDLGITHHIDTGGGLPGISRGGALGGGGTVSVSGSDTAGTINISTGGGTAAGCFATLNFAHSFGSTPHIIATPVGAAAAGIQYYITRSTGSFSLCTANAAPSGTSFGFDYIVID